MKALKAASDLLDVSERVWQQQLRRTHVLQYVSSKVQTEIPALFCPSCTIRKREREREREREKWGYPFQHLSHVGEADAEFSEPEHHSGTRTGRHLGISIQTITNIAQEELTLKTQSVCVCVCVCVCIKHVLQTPPWRSTQQMTNSIFQ